MKRNGEYRRDRGGDSLLFVVMDAESTVFEPRWPYAADLAVQLAAAAHRAGFSVRCLDVDFYFSRIGAFRRSCGGIWTSLVGNYDQADEVHALPGDDLRLDELNVVHVPSVGPGAEWAAREADGLAIAVGAAEGLDEGARSIYAAASSIGLSALAVPCADGDEEVEGRLRRRLDGLGVACASLGYPCPPDGMAMDPVSFIRSDGNADGILAELIGAVM